MGVGGGGFLATGGYSEVLGAAGATGSSLYAYEGLEQAFGNYEHTEGLKVEESFLRPTESFAYERGRELVTDAVGTVVVGGTVQAVLNEGTKLARTVVKNRGISTKNLPTTATEVKLTKGKGGCNSGEIAADKTHRRLKILKNIM